MRLERTRNERKIKCITSNKVYHMDSIILWNGRLVSGAVRLITRSLSSHNGVRASSRPYFSFSIFILFTSSSRFPSKYQNINLFFHIYYICAREMAHTAAQKQHRKNISKPTSRNSGAKCSDQLTLYV